MPRFSQADYFQLRSQLMNNQHPPDLDLSNRQLSDTYVRSIFVDLRSNDSVMRVNISNNHITNSGAVYIMWALSNERDPLETDIIELDISNNYIRNQDYIRTIEASILRNQNLATTTTLTTSTATTLPHEDTTTIVTTEQVPSTTKTRLATQKATPITINNITIAPTSISLTKTLTNTRQFINATRIFLASTQLTSTPHTQSIINATPLEVTTPSQYIPTTLFFNISTENTTYSTIPPSSSASPSPLPSSRNTTTSAIITPRAILNPTKGNAIKTSPPNDTNNYGGLIVGLSVVGGIIIVTMIIVYVIKWWKASNNNRILTYTDNQPNAPTPLNSQHIIHSEPQNHLYEVIEGDHPNEYVYNEWTNNSLAHYEQPVAHYEQPVAQYERPVAQYDNATVQYDALALRNNQPVTHYQETSFVNGNSHHQVGSPNIGNDYRENNLQQHEVIEINNMNTNQYNLFNDPSVDSYNRSLV